MRSTPPPLSAPSGVWVVFAAATAFLVPAAEVGAQNIVRRVVHVWVDPHYGNDTQASQLNPVLAAPCPTPVTNGCGTPVCPGQVAYLPNDEVDGSGAALLHAPWPFKTINGPLGAIRYITAGGAVQLPYLSPITNVRMDFAIIHCLPGRYAPSTDRDDHSGLEGNGETFPIRLPNRVCIQGASALNTVFDLEWVFDPMVNGIGPMFWFGEDTNHTGEGSFIDSISVTGVGPDADEPQKSTVFYMDPANRCTPTISNCFIYANSVGVVLDAGTDPSRFHQVTLVNNTFAFNDLGIWNGQDDDAIPTSVGVSRLIMVNNLIDATPPQPMFQPGKPFPESWNNVVQASTPFGRSAFEGVDIVDVQTAAGVDTNAYEGGGPGGVGPTPKYQTGNSFPRLGLRTTVPGGNGSQGAPPSPGMDIADVTGHLDQEERGVLFVRDLMHNAAAVYDVAAEFDLSPGDFRLAPATAPSHDFAASPNAPNALHRLVDAGFSGPFPLTMASGLQLTAPPGKLPLGSDQQTFDFDNWGEDCEGFGNPRLFDHPVYPTTNAGGPIDIGADELGVLIVAGYRTGSTMFVETKAPQELARTNMFFWMLGPPDSLTPTGPNGTRPYFSGVHHLVSLASDPGSAAASDWWWGQHSNYVYYRPPWNPGISALVAVDITPHLLPDVHPLWQQAAPGWVSYPFWQTTCTPGAHNPTLYQDPTAAVANPPGTYEPTQDGFNWLEFLQNPGAVPFGPFLSGGPPAVQSFGTWCQNQDPSTADFDDLRSFTLTPQGTVTRFSTEHRNGTGEVPFGAGSGSNLQSFAVLRQN